MTYFHEEETTRERRSIYRATEIVSAKRADSPLEDTVYKTDKKQLNRLRRAYDVLCALECETEKKYRACARESLPQSSHLMRTSVERSSAQHTTSRQKLTTV